MGWIAVDTKGHLLKWPWRFVKEHIARHHKRRHRPKPIPVGDQAKTVVMYDDINLALIPKDAEAVGGYVGGKWPTYATGQIQKKWPDAYHLGFAVSAGLDADALDIERGDAHIGDAPAWVRRQLARRAAKVAYNTPHPVVYIDRADADNLVAYLAKSGLKHGTHYLLATAHYTGVAHFCGPKTCGLAATADATQWTDKAHGKSLDEWVCSPGFFLPKATPV